MKKKTVNFTAHDLDENWQFLANAICLQAVQDFEYLISDKPRMGKDAQCYCNLTEIWEFAKRQTLTNLDMVSILKKIERNYFDKMKPYIQEHGEEIKKSWDSQNLKKTDKAYKKKHHPYFCPNCGGILFPYSHKIGGCYFIVCDGCCLNARIPRKGVK